jgi:hypothetical protein
MSEPLLNFRHFTLLDVVTVIPLKFHVPVSKTLSPLTDPVDNEEKSSVNLSAAKDCNEANRVKERRSDNNFFIMLIVL